MVYGIVLPTLVFHHLVFQPLIPTIFLDMHARIRQSPKMNSSGTGTNYPGHGGSDATDGGLILHFFRWLLSLPPSPCYASFSDEYIQICQPLHQIYRFVWKYRNYQHNPWFIITFPRKKWRSFFPSNLRTHLRLKRGWHLSLSPNWGPQTPPKRQQAPFESGGMDGNGRTNEPTKWVTFSPDVPSGIFICLHDWVIFGVNVDKYSIHAAYGYSTSSGRIKCLEQTMLTS